MKVLASPAFKNSAANPYNAALYGAMTSPEVEVAEFSKRRVFLEKWDVIHIHWPDTPLHNRSGISAAFGVAYHLLRLAYAKLRGARIVWTVHNLASHHTAHPLTEKVLWKCFIPLVDSSLHLSRSGMEMAVEKFPALQQRPCAVIPHGHYRDCYENRVDKPTARRALGIDHSRSVIGFVGQIKAYKNVPELILAFQEGLPGDPTLLIAGKVGEPALDQEIRDLASQHSQIDCRFGLIPADEMQHYLNACDLAVFPYREILNSGSAILALSFDRPVLVPKRGAMAELQELVGAEWVMTYDGNLTNDILEKALVWATEGTRPQQCDLSPLNWKTISAETLAVYRSVAHASPLNVTAAVLEGAPQ